MTGCLAAGLISVALLAGCGGGLGDGGTADGDCGRTRGTNLEQPLSPAGVHGRDLFVQPCGSCHTFDAAGTVGQIGPNLDDIAVNEADVLRDPGPAYRAGGRTGNMPRNLVTGQDARDVAAFVSANASGSSTP